MEKKTPPQVVDAEFQVIEDGRPAPPTLPGDKREPIFNNPARSVEIILTMLIMSAVGVWIRSCAH